MDAQGKWLLPAAPALQPGGTLNNPLASAWPPPLLLPAGRMRNRLTGVLAHEATTAHYHLAAFRQSILLSLTPSSGSRWALPAGARMHPWPAVQALVS